MEVDPVKLGSWKHEGEFEKGIFLAKKQYAIIRNGKKIVKTAGAPTNTFTWEEIEKVYRHDVKITKRVNKMKLERHSMEIKYIGTDITLKNSSSGHMKIYGLPENGQDKIYLCTLPLIIKAERTGEDTLTTTVYNPKERLRYTAGKEVHTTYEESLRYPTNIKGVKLPYKISGEFQEGTTQVEL